MFERALLRVPAVAVPLSLSLFVSLSAGCSARASLDPAEGSAGAGGAVTAGSSGSTPSSTSSSSASGPAASGCGFARRIGDASRQEIASTAVDHAGNLYLAGSFRGRIDVDDVHLDAGGGSGPATYLLELDPTGHAVYGRVLGAPPSMGIALATDAQDDLVVALTAQQPVDFGSGPVAPLGDFDVLVAKLDPAGHVKWSRRAAAPGAQVSDLEQVSVDVDASGSVAVLAQAALPFPHVVLHVLSADGADGWSREAPILGGFPFMQFAPKFDRHGELTIALTLARTFETVSVDLGGGALTGIAPANVVVAHFDASGQHVWSRLLDPAQTSENHAWNVSLVPDDDGGVFVGTTAWRPLDLGLGTLSPSADGSVLLAHLDGHGATAWARSIGEGATLGGMARGADGTLELSGYFTSTVDVGSVHLANAGDGGDAFVATIASADGSGVSARAFPGESDLTALDVGAQLETFRLDRAPNGDALLSGDFVGTLHVCDALVSAGDSDLVVARLSP